MIRLGVSAGLTNVIGPERYTNSLADNGVGFGTELNFGAQARIDIPLLPLTPIIFINSHMLRGSGSVDGVDVNTSQNIWSAGVEAEYNILPLPLVKPYVSVEAAINNFGELKTEYTGGSSSQGSMTRYGGALGVGTMITIVPVIDLDASVKYHLFNLFGKDSGEPNINALTLNVAVFF